MSVRSKLTKAETAVMNATSQEALNVVLDTLEKQAEHVVSVQVLPDFSVDQEAALSHGAPVVTQGLVVCVHKAYRLSRADMSWFHPSVGAGRSVFALDTSVSKRELASVTELEEASIDSGPFLSPLNCSVGEYASVQPDEFGCESVAKHLIVDTTSDALLAPLYASWLAENLTAGDVDKRWKRTKFGKTVSVVQQSSKMRTAVAHAVSPQATKQHEDTYNQVLSDTKHVYFLNHALKSPGAHGDVLVKMSALGGYTMYTALNAEHAFYPSSMGAANHFYSWDEMSPQNCARIENTCSWKGRFNTQLMRPPSIRTPRAVETAFGMLRKDKLNMRIAHFSDTTAVHDQLAPRDILALTPTAEQLSSAQDFLTTPITMAHPTTHALMDRIGEISKAFPTFHLFNPELVVNDRLKLPREVYKHLME